MLRLVRGLRTLTSCSATRQVQQQQARGPIGLKMIHGLETLSQKEGASDRAAGRELAIGDVVEDQQCALLPDMARSAAFINDPKSPRADVPAPIRL